MKLKKSLQSKLCLLFASLLLFSCSDNQEEISTSESLSQPKKETTILHFKTFEEFNKKIDELSNLEDGELDRWVYENNPNSLYFIASENESLNSLPNSYKAILNSNSEFILGNKVVWYHLGKLYEFKENDNINKLKQHPENLNAVGEINVTIQKLSNNNAQARTNIGQGQVEARHQLEFRGTQFKDCSNNYRTINGIYKYVHELMTVQSTYYSSGAYSRLYLRVKLEWYAGRRKWRSASEPRDININLNLTGTQLKFANGVIINTTGSDNVNVNYTCSGDKTILLKTSDGYGREGGDPFWSVQTSGTIDHQLHGGYHSWLNYAVW